MRELQSVSEQEETETTEDMFAIGNPFARDPSARDPSVRDPSARQQSAREPSAREQSRSSSGDSGPDFGFGGREQSKDDPFAIGNPFGGARDPSERQQSVRQQQSAASNDPFAIAKLRT